MKIYMDSDLEADFRIVMYHHREEVGSIQNALDGSGCWTAYHLFDEDNNFIAGGWSKN